MKPWEQNSSAAPTVNGQPSSVDYVAPSDEENLGPATSNPKVGTRNPDPAVRRANYQQAEGTLNDFSRLIANGFTAGGADQLAAGGNAMLGDTSPMSTMAGQQGATGEARDRQGTPGAVAEMAGNMAQSALIPGAMAGNLAGSMAAGGGLSALNSVAKSYFDTGELPSVTDVLPGAVLGAGIGAAGYKLGQLVNRPIVDSHVEKDIKTLLDEGIDVTAGQATRMKQTMQREAGAVGAEQFNQDQLTKFSTAALKKASIIAPEGKLDGDTLQAAMKIAGGHMDTLQAANPMPVTPSSTPIYRKMIQGLWDTMKTYQSGVEVSGPGAPIVKNTFDAIYKAAQKKGLTGEDYQKITSQLAETARSNPQLAGTLYKMRSVIDDGMEDYISKTNPADAQMWQMARKQWKNLLVIQEAASKSGRDAASGLITPQALAAATKTIAGKKAYALGKTDFDDLAKAGQSLLVPLPVGGFGSADEIAKALSKRMAGAAIGSQVGVGGGPIGSGVGAVAGILAPDMLNAARGVLPNTMSKLIPGASATGGALGAGAGGILGPGTPAVTNPFFKAQQ